jgi:signal transduction histidine kinase
VREYSAVIEEESDRLTELIENLLTASRIQAERNLKLSVDDILLEGLAKRVIERFSTQTDKHKFVLRFDADLPPVFADETRLRQVLDNLVSNAIKYSPEGGTVEIGARDDGNQIVVYVQDQGVGLSAPEQTRIFERFYRVDGALSRKTQGTGLGLYLSRAIVEAHGGRMWVESTPGKGSTFYFSLPL